MTIELAVALPVLIVVSAIAYNALTFFGECAVFDRAFNEAVRVHAASPAYGQSADQSCALVEQDVRSALGQGGFEVVVSHSQRSLDLDAYTATFSRAPTLFGLGLRAHVFGVSLPPLKHEAVYVVDTYKAGVVI